MYRTTLGVHLWVLGAKRGKVFEYFLLHFIVTVMLNLTLAKYLRLVIICFLDIQRIYILQLRKAVTRFFHNKVVYKKVVLEWPKPYESFSASSKKLKEF